MKQTKNIVWYAFMLHKGMMYSDDEKVIKISDLKEVIKKCKICAFPKIHPFNLSDTTPTCPVKRLLRVK